VTAALGTLVSRQQNSDPGEVHERQPAEIHQQPSRRSPFQPIELELHSRR